MLPRLGLHGRVAAAALLRLPLNERHFRCVLAEWILHYNNQFDLGVGKSLRLGERWAIVSLDRYSAMNGDTVLSYKKASIPDGRCVTRPRC